MNIMHLNWLIIKYIAAIGINDNAKEAQENLLLQLQKELIKQKKTEKTIEYT